MTVVGRVAALWRYPVKSMAAVAGERDNRLGVYGSIVEAGRIAVGDPVELGQLLYRNRTGEGLRVHRRPRPRPAWTGTSTGTGEPGRPPIALNAALGESSVSCYVLKGCGCSASSSDKSGYL